MAAPSIGTRIMIVSTGNTFRQWKIQNKMNPTWSWKWFFSLVNGAFSVIYGLELEHVLKQIAGKKVPKFEQSYTIVQIFYSAKCRHKHSFWWMLSKIFFSFLRILHTIYVVKGAWRTNTVDIDIRVNLLSKIPVVKSVICPMFFFLSTSFFNLMTFLFRNSLSICLSPIKSRVLLERNT